MKRNEKKGWGEVYRIEHANDSSVGLVSKPLLAPVISSAGALMVSKICVVQSCNHRLSYSTPQVTNHAHGMAGSSVVRYRRAVANCEFGRVDEAAFH
jgi:hypothetical protein